MRVLNKPGPRVGGERGHEVFTGGGAVGLFERGKLRQIEFTRAISHLQRRQLPEFRGGLQLQYEQEAAPIAA